MRRLALLLTVVLAAGCGSADETAEPGETTTPTTVATQIETAPTTTAATETETTEAEADDTMTVSVYFLRDGRIAAGRRTLPRTEAVARAALEALAAGPKELERSAGLTTSIARELAVERLTIADGTARVDFAEANGCPSVAQIVYTLTQFPTVRRVTGNCIPASAYGAGLTRSDLEQVTPRILVESPGIGEQVRSPLHLTGTSNTYEATFMVDVTDAAGRSVAKQFVTATSGNGQRGTFDVTIPFEVDVAGGALAVYEESAEDGSQLDRVDIPLDLQPS